MKRTYRCPNCSSYNTRLLSRGSEVECYRCNKQHRTNWIGLLRVRRFPIISEWDKIALGVLFIPFLIIMVLVLEGSYRVLFVTENDYQQTEGTVITGNIEESRQRATRGRGGYIYRLTYSYQVGAERYTSNIIHHGYRVVSYERASQYAEKYPAGTTVTVHYLTDSPHFAMLEPTVVDRVYHLLWCIAIPAIPGIAITGLKILPGIIATLREPIRIPRR